MLDNNRDGQVSATEMDVWLPMLEDIAGVDVRERMETAFHSVRPARSTATLQEFQGMLQTLGNTALQMHVVEASAKRLVDERGKQDVCKAMEAAQVT